MRCLTLMFLSAYGGGLFVLLLAIVFAKDETPHWPGDESSLP